MHLARWTPSPYRGSQSGQSVLPMPRGARADRAARIRVVVPPGAQAWADLPIVLPEIRGLLHPAPTASSSSSTSAATMSARARWPRCARASTTAIRAVAGHQREPAVHGHRSRLPRHARAIEDASRWRVTGFAVNTHLMDDTTAGTVMDGWTLATAVRAASGLPIRLVGVMAHLADARAAGIDAPLLRLERHMLPPWRQPAAAPLPAARPVPLGRRYGAGASAGSLTRSPGWAASQLTTFAARDAAAASRHARKI